MHTPIVPVPPLPLQALIRKKPSGVNAEYAKSTTGRVCPEQVRGVCRAAMMCNLTKRDKLKI